MPLPASSVIQQASDILKDATNVRWTVGELVRWLNAGQLALATARPDVMATYGTITLVAGVRQSIPTTAFRLLDVVCNTAAPKAAVRKVDRQLLDLPEPNWRSRTPATAISHFYFEPRDPRAFYVYPPANAGVQVDALYATYPTPIAQPASGDYTAVTGDLSVADIYASALLDYVLFRAFSKDSETTANAARAAAHLQAFTAVLGADTTAAEATAP